MSARRRGVLKGLRDKKFFAFGGCACCTQPGVAYPYSSYGTKKLIIVATFGQSLVGGKPNVFAFDGDGNLLWKYDTGWFIGYFQTNRKVVDGITRDGDGNIYLAYSTTGKTNASGIEQADFAFGIQKLDANGNLLQDWTPTGWTLAGQLDGSPAGSSPRIYWHNGQNQQVFNQARHLPQAIHWSKYTNKLYWQHVGKLVTVSGATPGAWRWDCNSILDLNFNELASYGGSNYSTIMNQGSPSNVNAFSAPGKFIADKDGNLHIEHGSSTSTYTANYGGAPLTSPGLHAKVDVNTAAVIFDLYHTSPWGATPQGREYAIGSAFASRMGFDIDHDLGSKGYLYYPVTPNHSSDLNSLGDWGDTPTYATRNNAGVPAAWCNNAVKDACGNLVLFSGVAGVPNPSLGTKKHLIAVDNTNTNNHVQGTPLWMKGTCDWTWPNGDRFVSDINFQGCTSVLAAHSRVWMCTGGITNIERSRRGALTNNPCKPVPIPTYNDLAYYGAWTIDGTTGGLFNLVSWHQLLNYPTTASQIGGQHGTAHGLQGLCLNYQSSILAAVGNYDFLQSDGTLLATRGPFLFGMSLGWVTLWKVELGTSGPLALDATDVTATYADQDA